MLAERLAGEKNVVCLSVCLSVCLLVIAMTQERVEIQPHALTPISLSYKAKLLLNFGSLAQYLRVVVMDP